MKIGILGGTFDPIHWGHLFMAETALDMLKLDLIYFAPAAVPPHKKAAVASAKDRLTLVELSTALNPKFRIGLWDYNSKQPAYTYESVKAVTERFPDAELYFIVGGDSIRDFHTWKKPEEILKYCKVVGLKRPGIENSDNEFIEAHRDRFIFIDCPPIGISSSDIRQRLQQGASVRYYLHPEAYEYIKLKKLYTTILE